MEVRASRFVLEDSSGKEWIVMELDQGQPRVKMFGSNGQPQIVLSINEGMWPKISLVSPCGNPVIHLEVNESPHPVGSAVVRLIGDYPGECRKEIRLTNCGTDSQPGVTLEVHGAVIAKLP